MRSMTRLFASLGLLISLGATTADAEVLARYRGDFAPAKPAVGWQYLWNAKGEIGASANYEPLKWSEDQKLYAPATGKLPNPPPAAFLAMRGYGGHPGRGATQSPNTVDRYAIAAFTIPAGKAGIAWVTDGQVLRESRKSSETQTTAETLQLRVYLNDQLKHTAALSAGLQPTPFSVNLGNVTGGETVYVAIGPDGHDLTDGFQLDFRVAVLSPGQQPEPMPASLSIVPEDTGLPSLRRDKRGEPDPKFTKAHGEMLVRVKQTPDAQVVFLGDSITAGWAHAGKPVWDGAIAPLKPLNLGVAGDQTQHVLWRMANGELDGLHPKAIVLLIGTNNTGRYGGLEIAHGVEAIVKRLRERFPDTTIVLTAIFPRGEKPTDPARAKIATANEWIAKLAADKMVRFIDIGPKLLQQDGTIAKEIMPDFLHLAEPAYQAWADAVVPLIKSAIASTQ